VETVVVEYSPSSSASSPAQKPRAYLSGARGRRVVSVALYAVGVALILAALLMGPAEPAWRTFGTPAAGDFADALPAGEDLVALEAANTRMARTLKDKIPSEAYIVVDSMNNRVFLKRGELIEMDAIASTGSSKRLIDPASEREWVFNTPRGEFRVREERRNPVWVKPDWAFIEEGLPIPRTRAEREERGSLGEHGLYFGDGYIIHGTLYERLLGRSVSHGCIRLGRDDLRQVAAAAGVGTRIFIF
jgi:L,D-transpeptidase catalytic domain